MNNIINSKSSKKNYHKNITNSIFVNVFSQQFPNLFSNENLEDIIDIISHNKYSLKKVENSSCIMKDKRQGHYFYSHSKLKNLNYSFKDHKSQKENNDNFFINRNSKINGNDHKKFENKINNISKEIYKNPSFGDDSTTHDEKKNLDDCFKDVCTKNNKNSLFNDNNDESISLENNLLNSYQNKDEFNQNLNNSTIFSEKNICFNENIQNPLNNKYNNHNINIIYNNNNNDNNNTNNNCNNNCTIAYYKINDKNPTVSKSSFDDENIFNNKNINDNKNSNNFKKIYINYKDKFPPNNINQNNNSCHINYNDCIGNPFFYYLTRFNYLLNQWKTNGKVDSRYENFLDEIITSIKNEKYKISSMITDRYIPDFSKLIGSGSNGRLFYATDTHTSKEVNINNSLKKFS